MWEKIVLNLLSNAFKFTLHGEIRVALQTIDERVQLTVADTGCGIPTDEIAQVFERFHRVENTAGRSHEGTGIGLALVKELVALHDGSVEVDSALGQGSTFRVIIPATRPGVEPAPDERAGRSARDDCRGVPGRDRAVDGPSCAARRGVDRRSSARANSGRRR